MTRYGKLERKVKFSLFFAVIVVLLFFLITGALTNFLYSKFSPSEGDTSNIAKSETGSNKLQGVLALLAQAVPTNTPTPTVILIPTGVNTPTPIPTNAPTPTPTFRPTPTLIPTYSITGSVVNSKDGKGISGVSVKLSRGVVQIGSDTTDSSGNYSFNNLNAGSYVVTATLPLGKRGTTSLSQTVTVGPNKVVNFGMIGTYTISGIVFLDSNKNGTFDSGESRHQGVSVSITGPVSATTVTDNNGNYIFNDVDEGQYAISMDIPDGYRSTSVNVINFTLSADAVYNFGITPSTLLKIGGVCSTNTMDIILAIDRSGSMKSNDFFVNRPKIDVAKEAAQAFVDIFGENLPSVRIGIVQFGDNTDFPSRPDLSGLVLPLTTLDNTTNITNIKNTINNIEASGPIGGTCAQCGVVLANQELAAKTRSDSQKTVVFLTDGIANQTTTSDGAFVDSVIAEDGMLVDVQDGVNSQNILYNIIGVGTDAELNEPFLQHVANTNSGNYYNDPDQGTLANIFQSLAEAYIPTASINGFVFQDKDVNGLYNSPPDIPIPTPVTIELTGDKLPAPITKKTDSSGNFSFAGLCAANYTITEKVEAPWYLTTGSVTYSLNVQNQQDYSGFLYGLRYGFLVRGSVFSDVNKNKRLDPGELNYAGPVNITATGGTATVNSDNSYSVDNLLPGSYIVSANFSPGLLKGYQLIEPKPASFAVTVGDGGACSVANPSTGGLCDPDGNISNLNFSVSDSWPWMQFYGLGTRFDDGIDNPLPASTTCGGGSFAQGTTSDMSSPGIAFTGDASADYGRGDVSSSGRSVGGISYPEVYSGANSLKTSATGLRSAAEKAGYTIIQLDSVPACSNPDQHCNLQGQMKGFYATGGDLMIDQPLNIASGNYVIVADGDITFGKDVKITVAQGATLIIAAGKDMIVDQSISPPSNACPVPEGQLQGIFSAGRNFIVQGNNGDCSKPADTMLNIDGSLIINAELNGGTLQNQRDLCGGNVSYPSLTVTSRPDFILNLPTFIFKENVIMHEDTP
jgi:hypothetical protein